MGTIYLVYFVLNTVQSLCDVICGQINFVYCICVYMTNRIHADCLTHHDLFHNLQLKFFSVGRVQEKKHWCCVHVTLLRSVQLLLNKVSVKSIQINLIVP